MKINLSDISFVVQGPVCEYTKKAIQSIKQYFPNAEIILSTWQNDHLNELEFDKLVINNYDPGNFHMNLARQIITTQNGLKLTNKQFVCKTRADFIYTGNNLLNYWDQYQSYGKQLRLFKHRVIIPNMQTVDPKNSIEQRCFNFSDWTIFGLSEDINFIFDIELPKKQKKQIISPEQFIWLSAIRKKFPEINLNSMNETTPELIKLNKLFAANNLIVLNTKQSFQGCAAKYMFQNDNQEWFVQQNMWEQWYCEEIPTTKE